MSFYFDDLVTAPVPRHPSGSLLWSYLSCLYSLKHSILSVMTGHPTIKYTIWSKKLKCCHVHGAIFFELKGSVLWIWLKLRLSIHLVVAPNWLETLKRCWQSDKSLPSTITIKLLYSALYSWVGQLPLTSWSLAENGQICTAYPFVE